MIGTLFRNLNYRELFGTLAVVTMGLVLWDSKVVYPLRILVTFFHELSHAMAAWATGGEVARIELMANEAGLTWIRGGNRFLTSFAGYLGSVVWGGLLLLIAARTRRQKPATVLLGLFLMVISLWLIRPFAGFGFIFGMLTGAALLLIGLYLDAVVSDFALRAIGLTACFSVFKDFQILWQSEGFSDALALEQHTGLPEALWIITWLVLGIAVGGALLLMSCQRDRHLPGRAKARTPRAA